VTELSGNQLPVPSLNFSMATSSTTLAEQSKPHKMFQFGDGERLIPGPARRSTLQELVQNGPVGEAPYVENPFLHGAIDAELIRKAYDDNTEMADAPKPPAFPVKKSEKQKLYFIAGYIWLKLLNNVSKFRSDIPDVDAVFAFVKGALYPTEANIPSELEEVAKFTMHESRGRLLFVKADVYDLIQRRLLFVKSRGRLRHVVLTVMQRRHNEPIARKLWLPRRSQGISTIATWLRRQHASRRRARERRHQRPLQSCSSIMLFW